TGGRGRRNAPRPGVQQPQGLPRTAREGAEGSRRERDVEGGDRGPLPAAGARGEVEGVADSFHSTPSESPGCFQSKWKSERVCQPANDPERSRSHFVLSSASKGSDRPFTP